MWVSGVYVWCVCVCVAGSTLCKLCSTKWYWKVRCASFVVRSSTGKHFVQAF